MINTLIDKYGFSEAVAFHVKGKLDAVRLLEQRSQQNAASSNLKAVEMVRDGRRVYRFNLYEVAGFPRIASDLPPQSRYHKVYNVDDQSDHTYIKHDEHGREYRSHYIGGYKEVVSFSPISKITFKIGKETVSIDDPFIIGQIQRCMDNIEIPTYQTTAHRPTRPELRILKGLINYLLQQLPASNKKMESYYDIADIFGLFLPSWQNLKVEKQIEKIYNIQRVPDL